MSDNHGMNRVAQFAALVALAASACSVTGPSDARATVQEQRELFRRAVGGSYAYDYRNVRFAIGPVVEPVHIRVRGSAIVSVVSLATGQEVSPEAWSYYLTVESLFRTLEDAYANGAAEVRAEYHPQLGHPTDVYIDYDRRVADEEAGYVLSNLAPERN